MEFTPVQTALIAIKSGAITLLIFQGVLFLQQGRRQVNLLGALFVFGIAAYQFCTMIGLIPALAYLRYFFLVGCFGAPFLLWVFSRALFDDEFRFGPVHLLIFLAVQLFSFLRYFKVLAGWLAGAPDLANLIGGLFPQVFSLIFVGLAVASALKGRDADLIEGRRGLRTGLVIIVGIYSVLVLVTEIYLKARGGGDDAPLYLEVFNSLAIFLMTASFTLALVQMRGDLFRPSPGLSNLAEAGANADGAPANAVVHASNSATAEDPQAGVIAAGLAEEMNSKKLYRQEGLTIRQLAAALSVQEYRLRRLINGRLGYRNFNDYLNQYRVSEAREILADPERRDVPVLRIAMDLGYGSLATFNRAFRNLTEKTPTQFRADALAAKDS